MPKRRHPCSDVDTFKVISLDEYRGLRQKGAPQAIPSMCVLVIKTDETWPT